MKRHMIQHVRIKLVREEIYIMYRTLRVCLCVHVSEHFFLLTVRFVHPYFTLHTCISYMQVHVSVYAYVGTGTCT